MMTTYWRFVYICIDHWAEVCVRGGGLIVCNVEEQWEAILIISAAAPAISTCETDRAKHQLMQ